MIAARGTRIVRPWLIAGSPLLAGAGAAFLASTLTGLLGFAFWLAAARLYPAQSVGLASAAVSAIFLIGNLGRLGLDYALAMRLPQVPSPQRRAGIVMAGLALAAAASASFAVAFLVQGSFSRPVRDVLLESGWLAGGFVLACGAWGAGLVLEQLLLVGRYGKLLIGKNAAFSVARIAALAALLPLVDSRYGVLAATLVGVVAAMAVVALPLWSRLGGALTSARDSLAEVSGLVGKVGLGNYVPALVLGLPGWLLPVLVVDRAGSAEAAHFYTAWMIVTLVNSAPAALAAGLLAEGARKEGAHERNRLIVKAYKYAALCILPAAVLVIAAAFPILSIFGPGYAQGGERTLQWLALACVPYTLVQVNASRLRLDSQPARLLALSAVMSGVTLAGSYLLLPIMGLEGAGVAWLAGTTLAASISFATKRTANNE